METKNLTVEQFKALCNTSVFRFSIFRKKNAKGEVETQYCHDANGNVVKYVDANGEEKPLPKVLVKDTADNIVAFCSAAVAKSKLTGGKALEGAYFEASRNADGTQSWQLRKQANREDIDLGAE